MHRIRRQRYHQQGCEPVDVSDAAATVRGLIGNHVTGVPPVVAINAGSAATVKSTNAITYINGGLILSKTALSAQALTVDTTVQLLNTFQATFYTQPASTTVYYVLVLDAAGTVKCVQGAYSGQTLNPYQMEYGRGEYPLITNTYTPFCIIKAVTAATTFLIGTDALDKANVTFTFKDVAMLTPSSRCARRACRAAHCSRSPATPRCGWW